MAHYIDIIKLMISNLIPKREAQSIMEELDDVRNPINRPSLDQRLQSVMDEIKSDLASLK